LGVAGAIEKEVGLFIDGVPAEPASGEVRESHHLGKAVGIDMPYAAFPGIPFGGYRQPGFGRELGVETLGL